jgi:predicted methyltransferase
MQRDWSIFPAVLSQAHNWVRAVIRPGDTAVDATVGNGHDTVFLAGCVGPTGRVVGFDIQPAALSKSHQTLVELGYQDRVNLVELGHQGMSSWFARHTAISRPRAVMFNLGYLPGGDKAIITRTETTLAALRSALELVVAGGIITVVAYPGHVEGESETEAVIGWARSIPTGLASVAFYQFLNSSKPSPWLVAVSRRETAWQADIQGG